MFDKFGEFDSVEELNLAAEGLFNEGDFDSIRVLARENGIQEDFVQMYLDGDIPELADASMAAMGKIDTELPEAQKQFGMTAVCIAEYVKSLCDREAFARAVRRKGKRLEACLKNMQAYARKQVKKETGCQCVCIPPSAGFKMVQDYYMKEEQA